MFPNFNVFFVIIIFLKLLNAQILNTDEKLTIRYIKQPNQGIEVLFPNKAGTQIFAFHGAINRFIEPGDFGDFYGIAIKSKNNFWVYSNQDIRLKKDDILYYWYHWQIYKIQYNSKTQKISGADIGRPTKVTECNPSITRVNHKNIKCAGNLIFEETFENFKTDVWKHIIKMPRDDYTFVSYQDDYENINVNDNNLLQIYPTTRYDELFVRSINETFELPKCTSVIPEECKRVTYFNSIIPPVVSAKIISKFSFLYGMIEVRAKLPIGDWILPEINLEPRDYFYTKTNDISNEYSSGQLRIACIRGNRYLVDATNDTKIYDGRVLYGGAIVEPFGVQRNFLKQIKQNKHFGETFHVYSLKWYKEKIEFYVDGTLYGTINDSFKNDKYLMNAINEVGYGDGRINAWKSSTNAMAPFDKEFVIALGLTVGGLSDFPDNTISTNGITKPWYNTDVIPEIKFYKNKENWMKTWSKEHSSLKIDYIRVYSI